MYFEKYNTKYTHHLQNLKKYEIPIYCYGIGYNPGNQHIDSSYALKISEIQEYLKEFEKSEEYNFIIEQVNKKRKKTTISSEQVGKTHFETFLIRLQNYPNWDGLKKDCIYTKEKIVNHIEKKLSGNMSNTTVNSKIRDMINLLMNIKDMLDKYDKNEVYLLSDAQINLYMRTMTTKTNKIELYRFLASVNMDLKKLGLVNKLKFNFDKIKDPRKKEQKDIEEWENTKKDLYDFETYAKVFNYLIDIDKHVPKIIHELEKKGSIVYASLWLYLMLHLNNAWRNGDCNRFPELIIKDLIEEYKIDDIKWFDDNRLSLPQSQAIIFRVRQWEMRMSKTQMNGVFFCSEELAPAFATAVIILHLYKYDYSIVNENKENNLVMDFGTSDNNVTETMTKKFFKPSNIKGFKFSSRKFNKSIMTYIYFLANLSGDEKALVYAKELRKHLDINSTTNYVDFDINKIESMSRQLFARGEFGYIPALLAQKVLGGGELGSFEEMTNQIMRINAVFDDIQNINNTARFLNIIKSERQNVLDMISEKSFKECQELYTNLCTMDLPSKCGSDIQCLFSKQSCQMPNLDDEDDCSCFDCPYHIPSIYALTRLCKSLVDNYKLYLGLPKNIDLKNFKNYLLQNPDTKSNLSKMSKMQTGLKIKRRKLLLREAIQKYGGEYVYRCLNIDRQTFIELSDIVKLDFHETYPQLS